MNELAILIPDEMTLVEESKGRYVYVSDEGVSISLFMTDSLDESKLDNIAAITLFKLSQQLESFSLISEDRDWVIGDKRYVRFLYSYVVESEEFVTRSLYTSHNSKLVNIMFTAPKEMYNEWSPHFDYIMSDLEYQ